MKNDNGVDDGATNLATDIAHLFDAFLADGPGKSQFIRMRYVCASQPLHEEGGKMYEPFCYGPLVEVDCEKMTVESPDESFGVQLLKHAHQLARADPGLRKKGAPAERKIAVVLQG